MPTKIVQGISEPPILLNPAQLDIFHNIQKSGLPVANIVFRQVADGEPHLIILHMPGYRENIEYIDYNTIKEFGADMIEICTEQNLNRSSKRKCVYNQNVYFYKYWRYTSDSFLQPNLDIAIKMYDQIVQIIQKAGISNIIGFGEDCFNIAEYIKNTIPITFYGFAHSQQTIDLSDFCGTCNIQEWTSKITSKDLLIITPGRYGMKADADIIYSCGFKRILYIGCRPTTIAKDYATFCEFAQNPLQKYYKKGAWEFPEMFTYGVGYLETMELWSRPIPVSLGDSCSVAYHLKQCCGPFKWVSTPNLQTVCEVLTAGKFQNDQFYTHRQSNLHFYIENGDTNGMIVIRYPGHIEFPHYVRTNYYDTDYPQFLDKIGQRLAELCGSTDKIYIGIRYESQPQKITAQILDTLLHFFEHLIFIFPNDKYSLPPHQCITIIRDTWTDQHKSWKREGLHQYFKDF